MKLTEEIDAMRTIGVSPTEALVIPRMLATLVMMPLLSFYAMIMAILGGGIFCWISLGIPPLTFVQRLQEVTPITDLWVGLIKAPVFGFIIALVGCFQGMQVEGDAEAGRPAHHQRGRPGHLPGHRHRRVLRRLLQRRIGWSMSDAARQRNSRHPRPRPEERFVKASRSSTTASTSTSSRGEILGVVGGSGTGKSVLMRSIIGLQTPDDGDVEVFGENMIGRDEDEAKNIRRRWGVLFQNGALFSTLTVAENVEVPLREYFHLTPHADGRDRQLQDRHGRAARRMRARNIRPSCRAAWSSAPVSRGRSRWIRSCCSSTSRRPASTRSPPQNFDELILTLRDNLDLTVFLITHDLDTLYAICDRVAVLADKRSSRSERFRTIAGFGPSLDSRIF